MDKVVAVIANSCYTNRVLSRRIEPTFIGCYRNSYNLTVNNMITENGDLVDIVPCLMKKLLFLFLQQNCAFATTESQGCQCEMT